MIMIPTKEDKLEIVSSVVYGVRFIETLEVLKSVSEDHLRIGIQAAIDQIEKGLGGSVQVLSDHTTTAEFVELVELIRAGNKDG